MLGNICSPNSRPSLRTPKCTCHCPANLPSELRETSQQLGLVLPHKLHVGARETNVHCRRRGAPLYTERDVGQTSRPKKLTDRRANHQEATERRTTLHAKCSCGHHHGSRPSDLACHPPREAVSRHNPTCGVESVGSQSQPMVCMISSVDAWVNEKSKPSWCFCVDIEATGN